MSHNILWLNDNEIRKLLDPSIAYHAVKGALTCHANYKYQQPLKPYIRPLGRDKEYTGGRFIAMPGYLGKPYNMAGIKWISGFPCNIEFGLPRASGLVVLNSVETGFPVAIMECSFISATRTAAVATIAFDHLAKSGLLTVSIFGAGPIAEAVIDSLCYENRNIKEFQLFDLKQERAMKLAKKLTDPSRPPINISHNAESCAKEADVIITATTGSRGYLMLEWIKSGTLLVPLSLDDCTPELFLSSDKIIVDDFEQSNREQKLLHRLVEEGKFCKDKVYAELGEIVSGKKPGRRSDNEIIYVNLMGMAIEDIAVANMVYKKAVDHGIGHFLPVS